MEKKVYKFIMGNDTEGIHFSNLKKAYGYYLLSVRKDRQVGYSAIARSIAVNGVYRSWGICSFEKITIK